MSVNLPRRPRSCAAAVAVLLPLAGAAAQNVTLDSLIAEMTDLASLAEFPSPPYTCRQFSSYDRASTSPADAKTWFANADAGQFIRVEDRAGRKEHVLADMDGPGAIIRIWSANPKGTLRIYLDGAERPAVECPLADYVGGKFGGAADPIACQRAAGWNSYLPIPYARHCKVTCDEGGFYYHVNYRTYAAGTNVTTFTSEALARAKPGLDAAAARLARPAERGAPPADASRITFKVEPTPGQTAPLAATKGRAAITHFECRVTADDLPDALRKLVLTAKFDGEQTVNVPLGDFFGAAPGVNAYDSLPLSVDRDGRMTSRWVMPFEKEATLELTWHGQGRVAVEGVVEDRPHPWGERSMHFHAGWWANFDVPTRPMIDFNYMTAEGRGAFVGASFTIANPSKTWWGEGDEKIYVDGEMFPSHFGTGTEDYFCYAWGSPQVYAHAYHSQPRCDGPANYGHTSVNRFHILDRIPFEKGLKFDMELWHWVEKLSVSTSCTTYWYGRPGARNLTRGFKPGDLRVPPMPPYTPARVAGAVEGEEMRVIARTAAAEPQTIDGCSNDQHLWWHAGCKPGDKLVLEFAAPSAGRQRVLGRFLTAADYGIHRLTINGEPAGGELDLYHKGIKLTGELDLGVHELKAGANRLEVTIVGANEQAVKEHMFGLDYLRFAPP